MGTTKRRILTVVILLCAIVSAQTGAVAVGVPGASVSVGDSSGQNGVALSRRPGRKSPVGTTADDWHESARSDKFTGGRIERQELEEGQADLEITVDVPAFRLTLWQNGREVKTYQVGIGLKEHPIVIGEREAREVIWNPNWIPPNSDWVREMPGVKPGEIIKASDGRNPLGKLKIPLGGGYLIHQAKGVSDLGNLVSHGCVRMLQRDLYDLSEKIMAAYSWPVSKQQIERAKRTKRSLVASLSEPLPVDINYDTQVVEGGVLSIYPDVYARGTNRVARLRAELETSGVNTSKLDERTLSRMLGRVDRRHKFVVSVESIEAGRALADGQLQPLVGRPQSAPSRATTKRRRAATR